MSSIISVENLGKSYTLRHEAQGGPRYRRLSEELVEAVKRPFRRRAAAPERPATREDFWALQNVSFEVGQGEVVGIIGRNGAGKSTLLKILSRITEPTTGRVRLKGRVASLLEVGTGFHPELTGRENVFLNGAILGMTRAEIKRKFDEIVAFAEVEKFLDTPVKHYSSGMYVRLAFSVAAHLDPEILVVDEVLAVGDQAFQNKCMGKMSGVAQSGRTILFVSHNMVAVEALCSSAVLLSEGRICTRGQTRKVIEGYLSGMSREAVQPLGDRRDRRGTGALCFNSVAISDGNGKNLTSLQSGSPAELSLRFENKSGRELRNVRVVLGIDNQFGQRVFLLDTLLVAARPPTVEPGGGMVKFFIPKLSLMPGRYQFTIFSTVNGEIADWIKHAGFFYVEGGDFFGTGQFPDTGDSIFVMEHSVNFESVLTSAAPAQTL